MRIPRIHHPEHITADSDIALCEDAANHVGRVSAYERRPGDSII